MAMVLSMGAMTAFAEDPEPAAPTNNLVNDATLTVEGLEENDTVYAYQVIQWNQNTGWDFTEQFKDLRVKYEQDGTTQKPLTEQTAAYQAAWAAITSATGDAAANSRVKDVLSYIVGLNQTYTTNADGTITGNNDAVDGQINAKLAGEIAKLATTPITQASGADKVGSDKTWTMGTDDDPVDAGLYLVLVAAANSGIIYNPIFVASDYYNPNEGGTPAANGTSTFDEAVSTSVSDLKQNYSDKSMAKKTYIDVNKTISDEEDSYTPDGATETNLLKDTTGNYTNDQASAVGVGDVVKFTVQTTIPLYASNYNYGKEIEFNVLDKLSAGLELVTDDATKYPITVKAGYTVGEESVVAANNYEITTDTTTDANKLTVEFLDAYIRARTAPTHVVITYWARITDSAEETLNPSNNTVQVEYSNNPEDETSVGIVKDVANNYTFSIDASATGRDDYESSELVKVGVDKDGNEVLEEKELDNGTTAGALQGAKFGLYTDAACTTLYTNGIYTSSDPTNAKAAVLTTDENGKLNFKGLDVGTYYLKEISAPSGYIADTTVHAIRITANFEERTVVEEDVVAITTDSADKALTGTQTVTYKTKVLTDYSVEVGDAALTEGKTSKSTYYVNYESEQVEGEEYYLPTGIEVENTTVKEDDGGTEAQIAEADNTYKLLNTTGTALPSTGGIGTTIFYVVGAILVIGAGVILITRRRMDA